MDAVQLERLVSKLIDSLRTNTYIWHETEYGAKLEIQVEYGNKLSDISVSIETPC